MREIKFRGKFKDRNWEYGGLRYGDMGQAYILPHGATSRVELVNRDTVGQFTGLKDKNGKEIYEGDLLRFKSRKDENLLGEVYVNKTCFSIKWGYEKPEKEDRKGFFLSKCLDDESDWEVIGNIYENPELIKETRE